MTDPRVDAACAAYKGVAGRVSRQAMVRALEAADEMPRPQRQDSLTEQAWDAARIAEREGMYDVADDLKRRFPE